MKFIVTFNWHIIDSSRSSMFTFLIVKHSLQKFAVNLVVPVFQNLPFSQRQTELFSKFKYWHTFQLSIDLEGVNKKDYMEIRFIVTNRSKKFQQSLILKGAQPSMWLIPQDPTVKWQATIADQLLVCLFTPQCVVRDWPTCDRLHSSAEVFANLKFFILRTWQNHCKHIHRLMPSNSWDSFESNCSMSDILVSYFVKSD